MAGDWHFPMAFMAQIHETQRLLLEAQDSLNRLQSEFQAWRSNPRSTTTPGLSIDFQTYSAPGSITTTSLPSIRFTPGPPPMRSTPTPPSITTTPDLSTLARPSITLTPVTAHHTPSEEKYSDECPHIECANNPRKNFAERKNLIRHYTSHIRLNGEKCIYCHTATNDGNEFISHLIRCAKKKSSVRPSASTLLAAKKRRKELLGEAGADLNKYLPRENYPSIKRPRSTELPTDQQLGNANVSLPSINEIDFQEVRPERQRGLPSYPTPSDQSYTTGDTLPTNFVRGLSPRYSLDFDPPYAGIESLMASGMLSLSQLEPDASLTLQNNL